ncbi:MAG: multidrug transporter [Polaromonas sp. 39-63-203]|jgi:multidrug efflux system outer membrane protein|uniref:efflux transporter outer membrane subunit n=1 Tax=Polaromonas sp. TaxID=1869339 RepID=UPI000BC50C99|nr:efflux transporter outer membrane subunit [Polaromonas sp.]OYY53456.1 MAG: multidrug transporter [Polaromonas sp. 35-63-240]OYZ84493.1 MAG: multidrug transporter [Polaromonas sp. 24-62-144]OZB00429.1 MAG: multidrug transporter [Polaromonas sp. 39-63-203]HQS31815.1 efflux transporter outer membrane subunit [Polaromonas sp.]HQS91065.1 efflux transporter outer membrane subunit [Polaromonas sp.]
MTKSFVVHPRLLRPAMLASLLLAAGCSMIPAYQRPEAPIAAAYPSYADANPPASPNTAAASSVAWQDFFADARLKELIDLALVNNRDLRVAVLNIEQARAQYQIRRADQFPTINAVASGSRSPGASGSTLSLYSAGLQATAYELDFFGRVSSLKEAALNQYLATEEGRKTAQITLIASVANAYLSILADDELLEITRQTLATREESVRLSKLRFDNGVTSELDYRQAESLAEAARVAYAQQQRQRAFDANLLTLLVGRSLDGSLLSGPSQTAPRATPLAQMQPMPDVPAGLPSELLTSRPDIRQAEQQLLAANANIGAARAAFFPRISLTVGAGSASSQLSGLLKSGSWGLTLAPQLVLPLLDAGRNQAGLDTSKAARDIAVAQYEKAIQTAFREVADALASRTTLAEQLRAQQAQANAEAIRFKLSDLRYQNGVANYLDLLDAQRSLFAARQAVVQTRLAQLQAQVTLYKALGGGWTEPVAGGVSLSKAPATRP